MHVAIVGASGLVGSLIQKLLLKRNFPFTKLSLFARTARGPYQTLSTFDGIDLVFFAAGASVSKEYIPKALQAGCTVIDSSSAFRTSAPLIIPEINGHITGPLISSPNCTTTIMLMALHHLHKQSPIKRIVASTYQAASGGGHPLMQSLLDDPLNYPLHLHDQSGEEEKMIFETQKILEADISMSVRCVRVPVLRAHSISANVEFTGPIQATNAPGLELCARPSPQDATDNPNVLYSIRSDPSQPNTYDLWIVGDQLLKGAALNAVQIAECKAALHC